MRKDGAKIALKNCAPFTKSITKIDGTTLDDAKHLELVMPMHNPSEYNSNYCDTTGLCFYSKDEVTNSILIFKITLFNSFIYYFY